MMAARFLNENADSLSCFCCLSSHELLVFREKSLADLLEGDFPSLSQDVIGRELAVFESVLGDLVWRTLLTKAEPA